MALASSASVSDAAQDAVSNSHARRVTMSNQNFKSMVMCGGARKRTLAERNGGRGRRDASSVRESTDGGVECERGSSGDFGVGWVRVDLRAGVSS